MDTQIAAKPWYAKPAEEPRHLGWAAGGAAAVAHSVLIGVGVWLATGGGSAAPALITHVGSASGMLRPATLSAYTTGTRCIEGTSFQSGPIIHRQGGCTGWGFSAAGDQGDFMVSVDVYLAPPGTKAATVEKTAHGYLASSMQGFLKADTDFARIVGKHAVSGIGDEAYVVDEVNKDGTNGIAKLMIRFQNSEILCEYTGSHVATPNSPFSQRVAATPQYAEKAAAACGQDAVAALRT
ncbi:hypothetical protein [Actinoallomurus sp. NPDC050550]|uniref:hypothetical protein n=1 Tax=Actinoallomurus sp. NPDC050550 TaxID=3154937 RepID=UPI0033E390D7